MESRKLININYFEKLISCYDLTFWQHVGFGWFCCDRWISNLLIKLVLVSHFSFFCCRRGFKRNNIQLVTRGIIIRVRTNTTNLFTNALYIFVVWILEQKIRLKKIIWDYSLFFHRNSKCQIHKEVTLFMLKLSIVLSLYKLPLCINSGTLDAILKMIHYEGFYGFYKGMSTKIVQSVLAAAVLFMVKEELVRGARFLLTKKAINTVQSKPPWFEISLSLSPMYFFNITILAWNYVRCLFILCSNIGKLGPKIKENKNCSSIGNVCVWIFWEFY